MGQCNDKNGVVEVENIDFHVDFFQKTVLDPHKSKLEGQPVYRHQDYIRIVLNRSKEQDQIIRPVQERDKARFKSFWSDYKKREYNE